MKHCILVKFKEKNPLIYPQIKELFNQLTKIDGIHQVGYHENCIDRENRYHFLIEIDMDESALSVYDESEIHKQWKKEYGNLIETKAIFDFK